MFNVTIIKIKDVAKIMIILIIIYVLSYAIFKNGFLKTILSQPININTKGFTKLGIDTQSNLIKNISKQEVQKSTENTEKPKINSIETILQIGSNLFEAKEIEKNIEQEEQKDNIYDNTKNNQTNISDIEENVPTQVVTQNPITESFNREYNGVKIKNGTSYDLTDDMLNTSDLNINTKNIIIFHTHTCESYTMSENYKYSASRKLPYNRFKLFCCKGWRRAKNIFRNL